MTKIRQANKEVIVLTITMYNNHVGHRYTQRSGAKLIISINKNGKIVCYTVNNTFFKYQHELVSSKH